MRRRNEAIKFSRTWEKRRRRRKVLIKTEKSTKAVQAECWGDVDRVSRLTRERELIVVTAIYEKASVRFWSEEGVKNDL